MKRPPVTPARKRAMAGRPDALALHVPAVTVVGRRCMRLLTAALVLISFVPGARAGAVLTFYSHDLRAEGREFLFPHAFVTLQGTTAGDQAVNARLGWTAVAVSPAVLTGRVAGHKTSETSNYIAESHRHFSVPLSDAQYR